MSDGNTIRIFNGGVAIITGGASGIGRALGEALAARGCEVVLADVQNEYAILFQAIHCGYCVLRFYTLSETLKR